MQIRKVIVSVFAGLALLRVGNLAVADQGQVITPEIREWANKVVHEEQSIGSSTEKNVLMLLYYNNVSGDVKLDPLQKGLTLMLMVDLSQVKDLQIVERVKLQALLDELSMGATGIVKTETAPRVGKLVGAQWVVGGELAIPKVERIEVTSRLLDVPTTRILGQPTSEGLLDDLIKIEKDMVFEIVKLLKIQVTPETEKELRKPFSTSMKAVTALSLAVDASDRGDYVKAGESYIEALKADPSIPIARAALNQMQSLGYISVSGWNREAGGPPVGAIIRAGMVKPTPPVAGRIIVQVPIDEQTGGGAATDAQQTTTADTGGAATTTGGATDSTDLLTSVSNATSQTRSVMSTPITDPTQRDKIITRDTNTRVTGTPIFPSPYAPVSAQSAASSANSMLKGVSQTNVRR